jgi:membrane protein DedA with SNARE-associated domain
VWFGIYVLLGTTAHYTQDYEKSDILTWISVGWFFIPIILGYFFLDWNDKRRKKNRKKLKGHL